MLCTSCAGRLTLCRVCRGRRVAVGPCRTAWEQHRQDAALRLLARIPLLEDLERRARDVRVARHMELVAASRAFDERRGYC